MFNRKSVVATVVAVVSAFSLSTLAVAGDCDGWKSKKMDVVETAANAGTFGTLLAAAEAAGLVDALKGEGPITVFAPTDDAFANLPEGTVEMLLKPENKDKLAAILTYHVAPGKLPAAQVVELNRVATLNGQKPAITLSDGGVRIDNAQIVKTDISASNGIIHVIDAVILPSAES